MRHTTPGTSRLVAAGGRLLALALATSSALVAAQTSASSSSASVALHPLVLVDASPDASVQALFVSEAVRAGLDLAPSDAVVRFLQSSPDQSCRGDDHCLQQLANAVGARAAVYAAVVSLPSHLLLSWHLVGAKGEDLGNGSIKQARIKLGPQKGQELQLGLRQLFQQVVDALGKTPLELSPLVAVPDHVDAHPSNPRVSTVPPAATAPHPAPQLEPKKTADWRVPTSIATGAVGLAGLVTGLVFRGMENQAQAEFLGHYPEGGPIPPEQDKPQLLQLRQRISTDSTVSNVGLVAGTALMGAGAVLAASLLFVPPAANGHAQLLVGPSSVAVVGTFP